MKHSYHTDIAVQYKLGILNQTLLKQIPSSTLHNWKNKDFSLLVGTEYVSDFEQNLQMIKDFLSKKALLKAAKALYIVYCSYVMLFNMVKSKKKIFRRSKEIIVRAIDRIKDAVGFERALRAFGISYQQFYAWKRTIKCPLSQVNLCRKIYYNQLTQKEVNVIKSYLANPVFLHWNITPIYYRILRDKAAFFSKYAFYSYVNRLHLQRAKPEKKKYTSGIRAEAPKHILHADVTIYRPLDHSKVYIYLLADNFSRFILNWKVSLEYSAKISFQNISEAYNQYKLKLITPLIRLITDDGSENKGMADEFISNQTDNMQRLIAQTDIIFSNSMVEAVNKRIKYDFLFTVHLLDFEQTKQFLDYAVGQYNNKPHSALHGLTPQEVFNGMLPDKDMFKPAIRRAAQKRKVINLNQQCLNCFEMPQPNQ